MNIKPEDLRVGQVVKAKRRPPTAARKRTTIFFLIEVLQLPSKLNPRGACIGKHVCRDGSAHRGIEYPNRVIAVDEILEIVKQPEEVAK